MAHVLAPAGVARSSHVSITVADLDATEAWWTRIFGFQVVLRRDLEGPELEAITGVQGARSRLVRGVVAPGMVLQFFWHSWQEAGTVGALLSFEVRDVAVAHAELTAAGVPCRSEPVEFDNSTAFMAADPNGIPIELIQWQPDADPYTARSS